MSISARTRERSARTRERSCLCLVEAFERLPGRNSSSREFESGWKRRHATEKENRSQKKLRRDCRQQLAIASEDSDVIIRNSQKRDGLNVHLKSELDITNLEYG